MTRRVGANPPAIVPSTGIDVMAQFEARMHRVFILFTLTSIMLGFCSHAEADVCFETDLTPDRVPLFLAPDNPGASGENFEQRFTVENLTGTGLSSPAWTYDVEVHPLNVALKFNQFITISTTRGPPNL